MAEWYKGNTPLYPGFYWVTVFIGKERKMYDEPLRYDKNGIWKYGDKNYYAGNIIAYMECNKPKEPYNEEHIGIPNEYYLRVRCNGKITYLSKGFQSVRWSKIGYSTKEKAIAAMKRYKKSEKEQGYKESDVVVVNGNGEEI